MRKTLAAVLMAGILLVASCTRNGPAGSTGRPEPPFQGEAPQEAYVYKGETGTYGGTMVLGLQTDIGTFNVINATDDITAGLLWYHIYRCPIDFRNGGDPPDYDPGLCTKWESSPDAKQWTFYLRKGVRWSDGAPFTVDDVLFTYDVIRDEKVENALRDIFIEGREENGQPIYPQLVKLDDHTFRFNLHSPNGGFLDAVFNLYLIPKHKWEESWRAGTFNEKMKITDDPKDVVGLGPFRVVEYVSGQRTVLERNPYFWKVDTKGQRLPYLDRLVFVISKDWNTTHSKFTAGELDVMSRVRAEDFAMTKRMEGPDVTVEDIGVSLNTQWLVFNQNASKNPKTGKPFVEAWKLKLFRDQKFRQAVSYGVDREGLANTVYVGRAVPLYSFVTSSDKYWYSDNIMKYSYDRARARQMLSEIGLKDTNGDGFLEDAEGNTVEITINTNAGNSQRENSAAFIAKNLQDIGIKAASAPVTLQVIVGKTQSNYDFDAILLGWGTGVPPGPMNSKNILLSSGLQHVCYPSQKSPSTEWEARVDELVHKLSQTADQAERKRMYAEIQRIWSEQLPEINLVAEKEAVAYRSKFGNVRPSPMPPRATWNIEEIYIK